MTLVSPDAVASIEVEVRLANDLPIENLMLPEIIAISRSIPENVNGLDSLAATDLANKFLKGQDMCGELLSLAVSYELKMSAITDATFSEAILVRAKAAGIGNATERKIFGSSDPQYLAANLKLTQAKMFKVLLEEKRNVFGKGHHLMKSLIQKEVNIVSDSDVKNRKNDNSTWSRSSTWKNE